MDIQVVLTENDPKLGKRGQVIKVSPGYAQNYLFPNRKAQPATASNLRAFEAERAREAKTETDRLAQARALAGKLQTADVELQMPAGEGDRLFGAVTAQDIVDALGLSGVACDRKKVHLAEPIKKLGRYEVEFRLHPEVTAKLHVQVVRKT